VTAVTAAAQYLSNDGEKGLQACVKRRELGISDSGGVPQTASRQTPSMIRPAIGSSHERCSGITWLSFKMVKGGGAGRCCFMVLN
jgi:hypothetical protein